MRDVEEAKRILAGSGLNPPQRLPAESASLKGTEPFDKGRDDVFREFGLVRRTSFANINTMKPGYPRSATAPVGEIFTYEHSVSLRVVGNIFGIRGPILVTVMRIFLEPQTGPPFLVVDIVAECLFEASSQIRTFRAKPRVLPILLEGHCLTDTHREYDMTSSFPVG